MTADILFTSKFLNFTARAVFLLELHRANRTKRPACTPGRG